MIKHPLLVALTFLVAWAIVPATHADARSKAAEHLVREQIARACEGKPGTMAPSAVIERDLTGDGKADLLLNHEGITCGAHGRSGYCGFRVCKFDVYVRRGPLLKLEVDDLMGQEITVGDGPLPRIRWYGHDFRPHSIRWDGREFR